MPKQPRYLDASRIGLLILPKPNNPDYALVLRKSGLYSMSFRDRNGKSAMIALQTDDPVVARSRRDELYRKAKTAGDSAMFRQEFYAQNILRDETVSHGIKFLVYFNGQKGVFDSLETARKFRKQVALEVIRKAREPGTRFREIKPKAGRKIVTEGDFKAARKEASV